MTAPIPVISKERMVYPIVRRNLLRITDDFSDICAVLMIWLSFFHRSTLRNFVEFVYPQELIFDLRIHNILVLVVLSRHKNLIIIVRRLTEVFMSKGETARNSYESARTELIQRLQLRDNVLLAFLGAIGAIFGLAFGTSANPEILLIVPYLALGATVLVVQHNNVIGMIGQFLTNEITPLLKEIDEYAPQWDNSPTSIRYLAKSIWFRTLGHFLLIIIPELAALLLNRNHFCFSSPKSFLWWAGLAFTMISVFILSSSHRLRKNLYRNLEGEPINIKVAETEGAAREAAEPK